MKYGKGILISNNQSSNSQNGGNGTNHYEGKFKEDMKHGRGILKVTYNY